MIEFGIDRYCPSTSFFLTGSPAMRKTFLFVACATFIVATS